MPGAAVQLEAALSRRRGFLAALLLAGLLTGCGGGPPEVARDLPPVPHPELATVEPGVRDELAAARQELDEALADPDATAAGLAEAFGELGGRYLAYDLVEPAAACYRNARRLAPRDRRWSYLLGYLQRLAGDPESARGSFERALELDPRNLPTLLHLAQIALEQNRVDDAESYARRALDVDPGAAAAHYVLGKAAVARRDFAAAVEAFERTLELQPTATRVHYALAQAHRRLGDREAARRHLELQGNADVGFRDPLVSGIRGAAAGAAAHMQRGAAARAAGRLDEAIAAYRQAVELAPENPEARRDLGLVLARAGRTGEAVDAYREALRLDGGRALTHYGLGIVLAGTGDPGDAGEALRQFRAAVEKEPGHRDFRLRYASQLAGTGRYREAVAEYRKLLDADPRDVLPRLEMAMAQVELGEVASASEAAREVLAADAVAPHKARARQILAAAAQRRGDLETALGELQRAVELDPSLTDARFALANLLGAAGRFADAARQYRRVIEEEPGRVVARLGEATALALAGREGEAVARLEEAVAASPGDPRLTHTLVRLLLTAGDPEARDPARALELAAPLFRDRPTLEHGETLALALAANGRRQEAADLRRSLLDQLPPNADPEIRRRLEGGLK